MPILRGKISPAGALVDVLVAWGQTDVAQLRAGSQPVPQPVQARALLDTGAESTCVDGALVRSLGLPVSGWTLVNLAASGGTSISTQHYTGLTILHPSSDHRLDLVITDWLILDVPLGALGYEVLIGRDLLDLYCRFLYDGPGRRFKLVY